MHRIRRKLHAGKLKRELNLFQLTMYGIGVILGAGIYALIGKAAGMAGPAMWLSFVIAGIIAAITGLSYAELSSLFPKDASEYIYSKKAFSSKLAFLTGWLLIITGIVSAATVAIAFAGYFKVLFLTPIIPIAIGLIAIVSLINFWGIRESATVNLILAIIEMVGLFAVILLGLKYWGNANLLEAPFGWSGVAGAAALIFFAFIGFEEIVKLSEESKKPTKDIPLALILSIAITSVIYILIAISAISILGWEKLAASTAPLADVAKAAFGSEMFLFLAFTALCATFGTVLVILLATSRLMYGLAQERSLPKIFGWVDAKHKTPLYAIGAVGFFACLFTLLGNLKFVASLTDFAIFTTFVVVNASVVALRYKDKRERPFKVPLNIGKLPVLPVLGALASIYMIFHLEFNAIISGVWLVLAGVGLYYVLKKTGMISKKI